MKPTVTAAMAATERVMRAGWSHAPRGGRRQTRVSVRTSFSVDFRLQRESRPAGERHSGWRQHDLRERTAGELTEDRGGSPIDEVDLASRLRAHDDVEGRRPVDEWPIGKGL